jgi:hypothetical protein
VLENEILNRAGSAPGSVERSLGAFDQLKRSLWNDAKRAPPMEAQAYHTIRNGVSDSIGTAAPNYPSLMHDYQAMRDGLQDIRATLGTRDNVAATTEILKLIKAQNDVSKNQLIAQLSKYDPTLSAKIAGAAVNQAAGHPSGWTQALTAAQWANLGAAFATMNPAHIGAAGLGLVGQKILGSPANVSGMTYALGNIAGAAEPVLQSAGAKAAPYAQKAATSTLMGMQGELDRQQRKSGGRVSDKLVTMVDRARKNINNQTESLLGTHDNHVAQALEIANRNLEG